MTRGIGCDCNGEVTIPVASKETHKEDNGDIVEVINYLDNIRMCTVCKRKVFIGDFYMEYRYGKLNQYASRR